MCRSSTVPLNYILGPCFFEAKSNSPLEAKVTIVSLRNTLSEGNIMSMNPNFFHSKHLMTAPVMSTSCLSTCWCRWTACHKITRTVLKTFSISTLATTPHGLSCFTWHVKEANVSFLESVASGNPLEVIRSTNTCCAFNYLWYLSISLVGMTDFVLPVSQWNCAHFCPDS